MVISEWLLSQPSSNQLFSNYQNCTNSLPPAYTLSAASSPALHCCLFWVRYFIGSFFILYFVLPTGPASERGVAGGPMWARASPPEWNGRFADHDSNRHPHPVQYRGKRQRGVYPFQHNGNGGKKGAQKA